MADVFADPHVAARNMLQSYQPPGDNPELTLAGNPIKFADSDDRLFQPPPGLGEHTEEVLAEFGIKRNHRSD